MKFSLRILFQIPLSLAVGVSILTSHALAASASGGPSGEASEKPAFVIVSDVDDTIKVSHILDPIGKVVRFLQDPVAFSGMSTLYHSLLDQANRQGRDHGLAVVTGTPVLLGFSVWNFLSEFNFPEPGFVSMRPIGKETYEFKSDEIARLLDQPALDAAEIVMIGDDTEYDHAAYTFAKKNVADLRKMNTQIFIRRVSGLAVNKGETFAFDSAADIAVVQFSKGHLSESELMKVFSEIESEKQLERLFVPGEYCPDTTSPRLSRDPRLAGVAPHILSRLVKVEDHLRKVCAGLSLWFDNN